MNVTTVMIILFVFNDLKVVLEILCNKIQKYENLHDIIRGHHNSINVKGSQKLI